MVRNDFARSHTILTLTNTEIHTHTNTKKYTDTHKKINIHINTHTKYSTHSCVLHVPIPLSLALWPRIGQNEP